MDTMENKWIKGIHASRYIASWVNEGGSLNPKWDKKTDDICYPFEEWLKSIPFEDDNGKVSHMSDDDAVYIRNLATNGKLELESLASEFMASKKNNWED